VVSAILVGLIKLGKVDTGVEALNVPGSVEVTIDLIDDDAA
jgi:hypothetical protein